MSIPIGEISTAALAYLGDCVIELCVRELLVELGVSSSRELNERALDFVRAGAQAEAVKRILPILSEEESAAFRRGRNSGHTSTPKGATVAQYRMATGMETLFGYLRVCGRNDRISELFSIAFAPEIEKLRG